MKHKKEFQAVFTQPCKSYDPYFMVLNRATERGFARLGIAVSRKVSSQAVVRNGIKRVVRESFRAQQHRLGSHDYVVVGRPAAAATDYRTLFAALNWHWAKRF